MSHLARAALVMGVALSTASHAQKFVQTNLVSDGAVPAAVTDPNLVDPWGVSASPTGPFWVSDNGTGVSTLYNGAGTIEPLVVTIPPPGATGPSLPTGQVFNGTGGFSVTKGGKTGSPPFIFAAISGTISGWSPSVDPANAVIAVDNSAGHAVYLGLALYTDTTGSYLLATNFASGKVEVYDSTYKPVRSFRDTATGYRNAIPATYNPYNVAVVAGHIFVSYAKVNPADGAEKTGKGLGFVDEVAIDGTTLRRFASHGPLNAPWGMALAPAGFGKFAGSLLVGNFGDGRISAYRMTDGKLLGQIKTGPTTYFSEPGLWALLPGNGGNGGATSDIYFSAGIDGEAHGLFGSLAPAK